MAIKERSFSISDKDMAAFWGVGSTMDSVEIGYQT